MENEIKIEVIVAFFSGIGATLIGFVFTMIWELWKIRKQESGVINIIREQLLVNKKIIEKNLNHIKKELKVLGEEKSIVGPMNLLNVEFINLLNFIMPKKLRKNQYLLVKIFNLSIIAREVNEIIISRESYKINNGAMSNYHTRIKLYDEIIEDKINELLSEQESLLTKL